jgi:hypothetical protein
MKTKFMKTKRIWLAFLIVATMITAIATLSAQLGANGTVSAKSAGLQNHQGGILDVIDRLKEAQERALEGTWRVTVTPPAGGPPPSRSYHTYQRGGGLIQSNLTEGGIPGQGVWARTGNNEFTLTFEKFLPVNPLTGQQGVFVFKVKEVIRLDGDTYSGRGEGAFCDAAGGQCIAVGCAQTVGTRMKVESPACQ